MIFEENNHYILWNVFIFTKNNTYMKKKIITFYRRFSYLLCKLSSCQLFSHFGSSSQEHYEIVQRLNKLYNIINNFKTL